MIFSIPSPWVRPRKNSTGLNWRFGRRRDDEERHAAANAALTGGPPASASTIVGSARVEVSPKPSVRPFRDLAQDAPHDLARAGLGKRRRELDFLGRGEGADVAGALPGPALCATRRPFFAGVQGYEGVDGLALNVVRKAHDRRFRDLRMRDQRAFDLRGADAMARDVDDIVDAAGDPVIAVLVAAAAVAGEIEAGIGLEIGLEEARVVAPHGAHLAGPGRGEAEVAAGRAFQHVVIRGRAAAARCPAAAWSRSRASSRSLRGRGR